jgi:thioredoxin 1
MFGKKEETVEVAGAAAVAGTAVAEPAGSGAEPAASHGEPAASHGEPVHISDETFEEVVLKAPVPALVDFWAPWCGPCRMVAPIVEDLAEDYNGRAVIAKINTDENVRMAGQLGIMGIPTVIIFKDGQEVDRVVGYVPRKTLEEKLKAQLD